MRTISCLSLFAFLITSCAMISSVGPGHQARLEAANVDGQPLPVSSSSMMDLVAYRDLVLRVTIEATAVMVIVQTETQSRVVVDWDHCRFVWPDGRSEPVLGATQFLGAGQVGLRPPSELPAGLPITLALSPASRAGRTIFRSEEFPGLAGKPFTLILSMISGGERLDFQLKFRISS